jgi:transposase
MTQSANRPDPADETEDFPDPAGDSEDFLVAQVEKLLGENVALKSLIEGLQARIAELERRLGLDSSNSSKPPSSDGPKRPARTSSLREPSGKRSGGQKGHPGETLKQVTTPDVVIDHYPDRCEGCGAALTPAMAKGHSARQVFDLPEPRPAVVTEHRVYACCCAQCGKRTQASFPAGVAAPVQYGPRICAMVVYLLHGHFLPEDRLAELMRDLFGVGVVPATIARMSRSCANRLQSFVDAVRQEVCRGKVKHLDETGFRLGGRNQWLHIASTALLTFYRVCAERGSLLAGVVGIVVHDHWKPYYTMKDVLHALCNGHHLRELKALIELDREDWARKMQILLRRACHAINLAHERGMPLKPQLIAAIERRYNAIVAEGLAFHQALPALRHARPSGKKPRRVGHNLLLRFDQRKIDVLRFLHDPTVPFTNNQAERDARMMKLRQKISGGFRTRASADDFATIRSVLSTARKQGWNILRTLTQGPEELTLALRTV